MMGMCSLPDVVVKPWQGSSITGGKVDKNPYSITFIVVFKHTDIWMVSGSKNEYQEDVCLEEIGLHVLKYDNRAGLNSQHDWRGMCDHFNVHENLYFDNE